MEATKITLQRSQDNSTKAQENKVATKVQVLQ